MFPARRPGSAPVLLRVSVAALLFIEGPTRLADMALHWVLPVLTLVVLLMCLGFLTSSLSVLCCPLAVAGPLTMHGADAPSFVMSILNTVALGPLGPSAYSLDARLFGCWGAPSWNLDRSGELVKPSGW
jgi:hypothetical protein